MHHLLKRSAAQFPDGATEGCRALLLQDPPGGCTAEKFQVDYDGTPRFGWNVTAAVAFIDNFETCVQQGVVLEDGMRYNKDDMPQPLTKALIRDHFFSHLKSHISDMKKKKAETSIEHSVGAARSSMLNSRCKRVRSKS